MASRKDLLQLHPSQVKWISLLLTQEGGSAARFECRLDKSRASIQDLVRFVGGYQPVGTTVKAWYQGRVEQFSFTTLDENGS